jgi:cysteinyl-tRNA synthetase
MRDLPGWATAGIAVTFALLACGGCDDDEGSDEGADDGRGFSDANDFTYWLQDIDLQSLGATRFDVAIIDYSRDGSDAGRFTAAEIGGLKAGPGGRKTVLAYCSVGEAEDYRWYWNPAWKPGSPPWLGPENPEWKDDMQGRGALRQPACDN